MTSDSSSLSRTVNKNHITSRKPETAVETQTKDYATKETLTKSPVANDYAYIEDIETFSEPSKQKRSVHKVSYIFPEIYVVVDNALFTKLNRSETKTREYVLNFMSAVNSRFLTLNNPKVELKLSGIQIGKSKSDTPYILSNAMPGNLVEAEGALGDLGKYFYEREIPNTVYDLVLVLTGEDL